MSLIPTDVGRPLGDLVVEPELRRRCWTTAARSCAHWCRRKWRYRTKAGQWHLMRIMPYRTVENMIDGVVVTFVDIGRIKQGDSGRRRPSGSTSTDILRRPASRWPCSTAVPRRVGQRGVLPRLGRRRSGHHRHSDLRGRRAAMGRAAMHRLLDEVSGGQSHVTDFRLIDESPGAGGRVLLVNARRLERGPEPTKMIVLSLTEATEETTGR